MKLNQILHLLFYLTGWAAFSQQKPNVVFILADDLGITDLGCYGNPYNETPYLDSLARKGMLFRNAYAASPICSPSRAAIMTGKHPARLHLTNFLVGNRRDPFSPIEPANWTPYLDTQEITLAEKLKTHGYNTGMIGKWHLGSNKGQNPWEQGFDYSRMITKNGLDYYNYSIAEGSFENTWTDDGTHYLTDKLTDYALEFIDQQNQKPFFLYMAYSAPHVFIIPRGDKLKKYFLKYNKFDGYYNPYYAATLESLDEGVGKIYQKLKANDQLENTIFIFTSDNGGLGLDELGPIPTNLAPYKKWKGHVYEGGVRIPAIVSWPGHIPGNAQSDFSFSNIDFGETLLDLIGEKENLSPDAESVSEAFISDKPQIKERPLFWHYPHFSNQLGRPSSAIKYGDYKLLEFYEDNHLELYNLKEDIAEENDLTLALPLVKQELFEKLTAWKKEVNANLPIRK